jgi:hypothetical protein
VKFGCDKCYDEDPDAAWRHHGVGNGVERIAELVDRNHFIISIRQCRVCQQFYVSVFTEFVDWQGGDDAQYHTIVPVTVEEAAILIGRGKQVDLPAIEALGIDRRSLKTSWPTGAAQRRIYWSTGLLDIVEGR